MKRITFNLLFYPKRTSLKKDGTCPVYARITVNGQRVDFVTTVSVPENDWDSHTGRVKSSNKRFRLQNDELDDIWYRIQEQRRKMEMLNEPITPFTLRDRYMGVDNRTMTILQVFDEHNQKCRGLMNNGFAEATVERYETTRKHLAEFIGVKYGKPDLLLKELNPAFINNFEYFLKTTHKCNHNSTTKYLKNFKKITRIALANDWMEKDPFAPIKFHLDEVDMAFLTEEELQRMMTMQISNDRLNRIRDIYVFSCFTGLAFSDAQGLRHENIEELKGQKWIVVRRKKTNQMCRIPLLPPALAVLEKYKDDPYCIKTGLVLPIPSNQKTNAYLQEIANLASIDKHLSTHTARHTFATTVTLSNNISIEVVAKMLGHSSINMTKKYARVVDDFISKDMEKIQEKYGK
jgi:site-specific recombinase XerD